MSTVRPLAAPQRGVPAPHNLDAEQSVLGAILLTNRVLDLVATDERLAPEHFYAERLSLIYRAILDLHADAQPIDPVTVTDRLRRAGHIDRIGGLPAIEELTGLVPSTAHAARYAQIVREEALARRALDAAETIRGMVAARAHTGPKLVEEIQRLALALGDDRSDRRERTLADVAAELLETIQAEQGRGAVPGLPTGLPGLDRMLGGLQDGRLYVIAARPSMGKSTLPMQIATHVAANGRRTLFVPLEMSDQDMAERHMLAESGMDPERLRLRHLREGDWRHLVRAASDLQDVPLHVYDDGGVTMSVLRAQARRTALRHGPLRLLVVDYLQLMAIENPTGNRAVDVGELSGGLKRLARELGCAVIAVSQLSRAVEARNDKRPQLSDLRESGNVEQDANAVLMLYRDDYYEPESDQPGVMEVILRKNRDGPTGTVKTIKKDLLRYQELATEDRFT